MLCPGLVKRSVGGQVFVLMPDSTMHILENETAVHLHARLESAGTGGLTVEELAHDLRAHFEVNEEDSTRDVRSFLESLSTAGVIREAAPMA